MKKKKLKNALVASGMLLLFAVWTVLIKAIDVKAIGPLGSTVGFAELNGFVRDLTGVNMALYSLTDWLGLIPIAVMLGFALFGIAQLIARKSLKLVDRSIIVLGIFYAVLAAVYVLFEIFPINYRPVLIYGHLEASYPSSTTLLVMCVMPTFAMQVRERVKNRTLNRCISFAAEAFCAFMVICRILSGVHWISDIIGALLFSCGLLKTYQCLCITNE